MALHLNIQEIRAEAGLLLVHDKGGTGLKSGIIYLGRCRNTCNQQTHYGEEDFSH